MKKAVFLTCLLFLAFWSIAQPIVWDGNHNFQPIGKQVAFLEDPAGRLTVEQVSAAPWSGRFRKSDKAILNFGFTESAYWIKFSVKNPTAQPLWLEIAQAHLPVADLYYRDQSGHWQVSKAGYKVNLEQKPAKHLFQVFALPQRADTFYVRLISYTHPVPLKIWNKQAFEVKASEQTIFYGIYVGILLFVIINNLFLFFSLRRFVYFLYSLLVLVYIFIAACVMDGFIVYFFPDTDLIKWYVFLPIINFVVSGFYGIVFLELRKYNPLLYRVALGITFFWISYAFWYRFIPLTILMPLNEGMSLLALGLDVVIGIQAGRRGNKIGYYYTLAYALFFLIVVVQIIYIQTGEPPYLFELSHVAYANLLEVLVLAYALSKRFEWERRDIQKAKADAQQRLLEQTLENERLLLSQNETLEKEVAERTKDITLQSEALQQSLDALKMTQAQLIQKEKMASLGELTAGIAHEIQNPLNFVNNFAEVSVELIDELKEEAQAGRTADVLSIADDLSQNIQRITQHGKRASSIVKGMLEHSRTSSGERQPTDLNALADEFLRLAYQGLRAKEKSFNATIQTDFAADLGKVEVVPQEIGRIFLNLFNNAFYAVHEKQKTAPGTYQPTVSVSTRLVEQGVEVRIRDNGTGIPESVKNKIFQPFFTTKPSGEGTGLGLSLSYDIVTKGHGGTLLVESMEGQGSEFIITLQHR